MTQTALGIKQYQEYMIEEEKKENNINIFETHIIPEDTMDKKADNDMSFQPPDLVQPCNMLMVPQTNKENEKLMKKLDTQDIQDQEYINHEFSLDLPHMIPEEKELTTLTPQDELMRWHLCLSHLLFKIICKIVKEG